MHQSVYEFVQRVVNSYPHGGDVLEVGSLDINGSVRDLFPNKNYWGVDLQDGPGVDEVIHGMMWYANKKERYDVVVTTEMLEHDPRPWKTLTYLAWVLKPGGLLILTARGFGPDQGSVEQIRCYGPHDYPHDYWRFSVESMHVLCKDAALTILEAGPDTDPTAPGVFVVGQKSWT